MADAESQRLTKHSKLNVYDIDAAQSEYLQHRLSKNDSNDPEQQVEQTTFYWSSLKDDAEENSSLMRSTYIKATPNSTPNSNH